MSEQTRLRYVPPGCQTGTYYITVCNLYMKETAESLRHYIEDGCVVDYIQLYPTSTSGWVRLKGRENFECAWSRLYKGVWNNRVIEAFDKNRHEGIMIKELIQDTEEKSAVSLEIQQSYIWPVCTHARFQWSAEAPSYAPFGQPHDASSYTSSPDGGVPISLAPWPKLEMMMPMIPDPRRDSNSSAHGVPPSPTESIASGAWLVPSYTLASTPETWSPMDTPSTGFSMPAGLHYSLYGAKSGEAVPTVYPTSLEGSSVCQQSYGLTCVPPPAEGYTLQAYGPSSICASGNDRANQRMVIKQGRGPKPPKPEQCMIFVSGIRFSTNPEAFKAWFHRTINRHLPRCILRIYVPFRKGVTHKLRGYALITFQTRHFALCAMKVIKDSVFQGFGLQARFAKRGYATKRVFHSIPGHRKSNVYIKSEPVYIKHEPDTQPDTANGGQKQEPKQEQEAGASLTSRGPDDPPLVVNGTNYRGSYM